MNRQMKGTTGRGGLLPLGLLAAGDNAEVVQLFGHAGHGHRHAGSPELVRLEEMGVRVGNVVEVVANEGHGPLLVKVGESRIAIGRGVAMKIQVRPAARGCAISCGGCAR